MTDRELLEMAAKAVGIRLHVWGLKGKEHFCDIDKPSGNSWNPLKDDGDALRLAVKLCIDIKPPRSEDDDAQARQIEQPSGVFENQHGSDPYAATRRAIVRAAAEIGKATP